MDKRLLALIILAYHSDVLENAFGPLSDDDYETAMSRSRLILDLDMEMESSKPNANEALWAVFSAISKWDSYNQLIIIFYFIKNNKKVEKNYNLKRESVCLS